MTTPAHLVDRPADDNPMTRAWLPWALGRVDNIATLDDPELARTASPAATVARALVHMVSAWHTVSPNVAPQLVPDTERGIEIVWLEQGYQLEVTVDADGRIAGWLNRIADKAEVTWGES